VEPADAAAIERVELFRSMPPDARQALSRVLRSHYLRAGEWLFRQGDPGDALYIVRSGRLELVARNVDSDVVVRLRGPGAVIGELALLDGGQRATSARALRDSQLWRLDRTDFAKLRGTEPSLDDGLIRVMADKLRQVGDLTTVGSSSVKVMALATAGGSDVVRATTGALIDALRTSRSLTVLDADPSRSGLVSSTMQSVNMTLSCFPPATSQTSLQPGPSGAWWPRAG
jgi:CRP/FNR family cyclic AMP-dependent transcriptional regulator